MTGERTLRIDALNKRYGDIVALRDMSFEVAEGELFGFVGSNGAGKTTTMRIVLGVLAADSGEVYWNSAPITFDVRRRVGYMPEERGLYPKMRVGEQLAYLAELRGVAPDTAVRSARRWTERLGIAHRIRDEVDRLSLGNQQRAQLAAALVHEPDILVLDEPFSGLDPVAVDVMSEVLVEQCGRGVPTVFSSHQLDLVQRLCDRVGIVAGGQMVAVGTVDELRGRGNPRLLVDAPSAQPGWTDGLTGVRVISHEGTRTTLELSADADDQAVLARALASGPVREFTRARPTLTELFRDVVSERDQTR